ncbi:mitochondrial import inner membrane translocase subunit Tim21 isoform X1 [Narcine bancroftii]|uniref:mitochondrial import inner membrane translocase subunit Tim21 isoform X1 n=1 Tax=Narcine bancroftii TaxID=1343680 RepID=UPI003831AA77
MNLASVLFLRAVRTPTARAAPPFQRQFRIHDSGRTGLCSSVSARPGAATFSCWLQKLDSPNCFRSVSSLYIHTQTRRRTNEEVSDRKREHRVSIRRSPPLLSTARKVKEAGKDLTYLLVVLVGIGITGGLFYVIFKELFSSSSPNKIYGEALKKCKAHPEIIGVLGEPIKGYGETTRRGRRRHVSHMEYVKDGVNHMQLKFYIEGSEPIKGTVHLDAKENPDSGKYSFRYIFVDFDTYPKRTIIVEDNR